MPALPSALYTRADARRAGMTRAQLRDDGVRVTRGAYVSRAMPLTVRTAGLAALQVLPPGAVLAHLSAAALWGAPVADGYPLHVAVPPGAPRARRRRIVTSVRELTAADVAVVRGVPVTSPAQTWLDLVPDLPSAELVAIGDALLRAGRLTRDALDERLLRAAGVRGVVRARSLAPVLDARAASRPESLVRWYLLDSPLPDPELQVPVHDRHGRVVAHGDLGYPGWKVLVEYEGRQHADREQFGRDVDRYSLMAADGWLAVRLAGRHVARPEQVVDRVGRALLSRGARWSAARERS